MPQLNPSPWFSIFLLSWFVFLVVIPTKLMAHYYPLEALHPTTEFLLLDIWAWPWF
uniref:ATP synthase complex subunit 8 n=1 Tax=Neopomacentrus filamentosus TaxID=229126 RepID=Q7Y7X1_9TELE|nr:ATP synthase 8 [Neopomacentrus filamentosus]AAP75375.1 ATP synthase 8 [Neopomacentrus filamentosus]